MPSNINQSDSFDSFEMSLNDISGYTPSRETSRAPEKRRRRTMAARIPQDEPVVEVAATAATPRIERPLEEPMEAAVESPRPAPKEDINSKNSGTSSIRHLLTDSRLSIFAGIVLLLFAAYSLLSAISYILIGNSDQSIVTNNAFHEISSRASEVSNAGGPVGAMLSEFLISRWLGLGAFVIIAYAVILAISFLRLRPCRFWNLTFKSIVSAIAVSIIAGAFCRIAPHSWFWGGLHGKAINEFMTINTGVWGDLALNIIMAAALILIFLDTIKKVFVFMGKRLKGYRDSMREKAVSADERDRLEDAQEKPEEQQPLSESLQGPVTSEPAEEQTMTLDMEAPAESETKTADQAEDLDNAATTEAEELADGPTIDVQVAEIEEARTIQTDAFDPTAELSRYKLPTIDLLNDIKTKAVTIDQEEIEENKERITRTLNSYGIEISSIRATIGPTITLYEIVPAEGVRISRIKNLGNDMALSLRALGIRIIAPIPGKGTIGMEVPNRDKQIVSIRSILSSQAYQDTTAALPIAMGTTITNDVYVTDLAKMPHLLVAGATGMGKSVGLNTIIASLLYKKHPAELKFVMIDPKMVEFSLYNALEKHFLAKLPDEDEAIVTDPAKVVNTLNSLCVEMDNRYALLRKAGVRDIKSYNAKFTERRLNPNNGHRFLPYIVVVVDEFADLILTAGKEVETPISRLAAKARAIGIHLILATQRPSVNVITGVIKANFPGRIAFRVTQMNDSRTILDRPGADQLIGKGDMIISKDGVMERVQCALIETDEVEAICKFISAQMGYDSAYELPEYIPPTETAAGSGGGNSGERDSLFAEAGRYIIESGIGSTTAIQRHFNVGFPRAGKIMDQLETAGVVGPTQGGKPRKVLMDNMAFEDLISTI